MRAARPGTTGVIPHSASIRIAEAASVAGTCVEGATRRSAVQPPMTRSIDTSEDAIVMTGSAVASKWARNSASRAALAATNCAPMVAEANMAAITPEPGCDRKVLIVSKG
jgi:hypothetical protein